jgi:hypothetical protein
MYAFMSLSHIPLHNILGVIVGDLGVGKASLNSTICIIHGSNRCRIQSALLSSFLYNTFPQVRSATLPLVEHSHRAALQYYVLTLSASSANNFAVVDGESVTVNMSVDGKNIALNVQDTASVASEYSKLRPDQYTQTDVFVICFSLVEPRSFESVRELVGHPCKYLRVSGLYLLCCSGIPKSSVIVRGHR